MRAKRRVVRDSNRANCKGKQLHGASVGEDETEHNTCSCDPNDTPLPERRSAESSVPESISYDRQFLQGVLRQLLCGPYTDREGENLAHWKTGIDMLRAVFPASQSFPSDQPHDIGEKPASLDSASNLSRNHWVSTSAQELGTFLKQGRALNAHTPTLRISNTFERFQDAEAAFLRFAQHREVSLMYQNWQILGGSTPEMTAQDFCKRYEDRMSKEKRATSDEFRNFLSISGAALEHVVPGPDFLRDLGYSLLNDLKVQVHLDEQSQFGSAGGKETKTRTIDCQACLQFVLYGERFSFSGWHLDVLNGTWLTTITGFRAWFIYTGPCTKKEQKELETSGAQWRPAAEHVEIILLRPGDTLIMRPGHPVVHCVLTLDDSIARGGMIWSAADIGRTIKNINYIIQSPMATNEDILRQFCNYLDALYRHVQEGTPANTSAEYARRLQHLVYSSSDLESIANLIKQLKDRKVLSCACAKTCEIPSQKDFDRSEKFVKQGNDEKRKEDQNRFCPCWCSGERVHARGCNRWCHAKKKLACMV